ncbi:transcription-silencing protein Clr2-domain-containing protein [Echria macrotheca]|uniref:Transcription-silencing protein Clr2-domain-containing protein n=1 Tax=Echria macrotheca TaxID=438768 RepID=A0AAJ0BER7_9PEZI|nr:transcription-silencing protein Clr2-domain-containing protein [Echria macrotheca]
MATGDLYYPLYIARSDGKSYALSEYNALDPKESKDMEQLERWEVIIGGHVKIQLADPKDARLFKLASLPKGYELRCAVRKDGGRDYFLYGHPIGPEYKYRTPGEFVPHLLWLASASTDYAQCSCEPCIRMVDAAKQRQQPIAVVDETNPAASTMPTPPTTPAQAPPPPPPGTTDVANVFRIGEMVWFRHTNAWRLGLVLGAELREPNGDAKNDGSYNFTLAPLGHCKLAMAPVVKVAAEMRPFLTFSVPPVNIEMMKSQMFDAIDWDATLAKMLGREPDEKKKTLVPQVLGLEASKMAARHLNDCCSFFNKLGESTTSGGSSRVRSYTGVYLGAEMIRVRDAIRVSPPETMAKDINAVMLASEIQLITTTSQEATAAAPRVQFRGDIYRIVRERLPLSEATFASPASLGPVFELEAAWRNGVEKDKTMGWGWMVIARDAVRTDAEVNSRFYVTQKVLDIIDPVRLREGAARGNIEEAQTYLNSRVASGLGLHTNFLQPGRGVAVGKAINPKTPFVVPRGIVED